MTFRLWRCLCHTRKMLFWRQKKGTKLPELGGGGCQFGQRIPSLTMLIKFIIFLHISGSAAEFLQVISESTFLRLSSNVYFQSHWKSMTQHTSSRRICCCWHVTPQCFQSDRIHQYMMSDMQLFWGLYPPKKKTYFEVSILPNMDQLF